MTCEICNGSVVEIWVCSGCYRAGHAQCLDAVVIQGYAFCNMCKDWAQAQHDRNTTEIQKQRWKERLASQLANWRDVTITTVSALSTVGLAIGSSGAMLASGTSALVHGVIAGAQASVGAASPALPAIAAEPANPEPAQAPPPGPQRPQHLPPPLSIAPRAHQDAATPGESSAGGGRPDSRLSIVAPVGRARSEEPPRRLQLGNLQEATGGLRPASPSGRSLERLSVKEAFEAGHCLACHTENRGHKPHLHRGDCLRMGNLRTSAKLAGHCLACHTLNEGHVGHLYHGDCRRTRGDGAAPASGAALAVQSPPPAASEPTPPSSFECAPDQAEAAGPRWGRRFNLAVGPTLVCR